MSRVVLGSDDGTQTCNWQRPVAEDLVPGAANTVLRTNAAGTATEWNKATTANIQQGAANTLLRTNAAGTATEWNRVQTINIQPGTPNTVLSTDVSGTVVGWNNDLTLNNVNILGYLRFKGVTPVPSSIPYVTSTGTDVQWIAFSLISLSQTNLPYRVNGVDSTTNASMHVATTGKLGHFTTTQATITTPAAGAITFALPTSLGLPALQQYQKAVQGTIAGLPVMLKFQLDAGGATARYFADSSGASFLIGAVVVIYAHDFTVH